jgi:hypothetical protein
VSEAALAERRLPPVDWLAGASMALVIVGGIYLAAYLPRRAPLELPIGLLAAAGALLLVNAVVLWRLREFAWRTFLRVAGWAAVAYAVIAGMLEYIFVLDHTRGAELTLMTLILLVFAIDIPILLGFGVARYQPPEPRRS